MIDLDTLANLPQEVLVSLINRHSLVARLQRSGVGLPPQLLRCLYDQGLIERNQLPQGEREIGMADGASAEGEHVEDVLENDPAHDTEKAELLRVSAYMQNSASQGCMETSGVY